MATVRIELEVGGNGQATLKSLTSDLKQVDSSAKTAGSSMDGMLKKLASAGAGLAVLKFVKDSLAAWGESVASVNSLNLALANQGQLLPGVSQGLQDYASQMQDLTVYDDDAVMGAQAMLASFGMNEKQIIASTKAAADLAAATGKQLPEAAEMLGKAFAGNTTALQKMGFHFTEGASAGQKFDEALAQINGRFGGAAAVQAQSYAGQIAQVKNAFGETQEAVGKFFAEFGGGTGNAATGWLVQFAKFLQQLFAKDLVYWLGAARASFAFFVGFVLTQLSMMLDKLSGLPLIGAKFKAASGDIGAFGKEMTAAGVAIINEAEKSSMANGKTIEFANGHRQAAQVVDDSAKKEAEALEKVRLQIAATYGAETHKYIEDFEKEQARIASDRAAAMAKSLTEENKRFEQWQKDKLKGEQDAADRWKQIQDDAVAYTIEAWAQLGDVFGQIGNLLGILGVKADSFAAKLAGAAQGIAGSFSKFLGSLGGNPLGAIGAGIGLAGSIFGGIKSLFGGGKKAAEEKAALDDARKMRDELVKMAGGMAELQRKAAAAHIDLAKLFNAKDAKSMLSAINEIKDALDLQTEAQEALDDAINRYGFTVDQLGPQMAKQKLDEKAGQLLKDWELLNAAGVDHTAILQKMGPGINEYIQESIKAGQAIPEQFRPIVEELIKMGLLTDANGDKIDSLDDSGISFTKDLSQGLQDLITHIDKLVQALLGLKGVGPITVPVHIGSGEGEENTHTGGEQTQHAAGYTAFGPLPKDTTVRLHRGEKYSVTTASDVSRGRGIGGPSAPVVFAPQLTIKAPGGDPRAIARAIAPAMKLAVKENMEGLKALHRGVAAGRE